ncbi:hypothetical protein PT974_06614 [Cladobotryum mycophilum]|uniref:Eisosome protein 1 n=1 Tax=Cladobotryum mycophilum TaxID=491253 RepID=A0ABR0SN97_9HYPO
MMQTQTATAADAGGGARPTAFPKAPSHHHHQEPLIAVSTAGRLKYADPRSLPSFPSYGLSPGGAAASAAATLGWANQKPVELWRPDKTSSASAAAVLAKDYKMSPSWEPAADSAGARAAILAVGSAGAALKKSNPTSDKASRDAWRNSAATQAFNANRPTTAETTNLSHGNSAATQAFNTNRTQSMRKPAPPSTAQGDGSLAAAKGAMSVSKQAANSATKPKINHKKSLSTDATTASTNALNGATIAHRGSIKPTTLEEAGAVSVTTMTRNMFTSHPPVKTEVDEKSNNERLHQSAVEMAKKMYQQKQKQEQVASTQASSEDATHGPYLNLQDAAYKQAQERLAKLHDEHQKNREFKEYYAKEQAPRRRFSVISKLRHRSSSDADSNDRERSEKIRQQMSLFSSQLSQVDQEKRTKDREALLAAAQRNVKAQSQGMDEQVYHDTGKVNPTMLDDWEIKAQHAAQALLQTGDSNKGKVNIGGGKFMDVNEVDAIAARRVQPVLDDINEKAEAERERLAAVKMEEEAKKAEIEREKARERELKEINKKVREDDRQQERVRKLQGKQEEKAKKDEERATKAEQKRLVKEEKRKSGVDATGNNHELSNDDIEGQEQHSHVTGGTQEVSDRSAHPAGETTIARMDTTSQRKSSQGSISPTSKVKGWIRNRFSRGKSLGDNGEKQKGFVGGAALRGLDDNGSTASLGHRSTSIRDVAMAGKVPNGGTVSNNAGSIRDSRGVSPLSSSSDAGTLGGRRPSLEPPRPFTDTLPRTSSSPTRDSRFKELMDR